MINPADDIGKVVIRIDPKILSIEASGSGHNYDAVYNMLYGPNIVDISKDAIKFARERFGRENIKYFIGDATIYDFDETFDYIILSNVLEHIKDRITFLKKISPLAKYILIRVPMINRSWLPLYKKQLGMEYKLDPTHYIEYTYDTFLKEIDSGGFKIIDYSIQFGEIWAKLE